MTLRRTLKSLASQLTGSQVSTGMFLIFSNLAFIPAIMLAAEQHLIPEICLFIVTMVMSTVYHFCQADFYCLVSFEALQTFDHFFVYSTLIWVVLFWVDLPLPYRVGVFLIFQGFLGPSIYVLVSNSWYVALVLIGLLIMAALYAIMTYLKGLPTFNEPDIITAALLIGIGLGFHIAAGSPSLNAQYGIFHSFWHIFAMLSIFFVIRSKFRKPIWMNKSMISYFYKLLKRLLNPYEESDRWREAMISKV